MNCESASKNTTLFLYGELTLEEEQSFQDHLDACPECRKAFEAEKRLHDILSQRETELDPALLARCRRDLEAHLETVRPGSAGVRGWFEWLSNLRLASLARPAGAVALVALGFFAARWTSGPVPSAKLGTGIEPMVTRVRYLNPEASGRVQVLVEETRQRTIQGTPEEEPIRRLLLAAARESADPGIRAESMDLLKAQPASSDLKPVLVYALEHDPNPGVRLKALAALKNDSADAQVRSALAQVLLSDDNAGVRAGAIDLLVQHKVDSNIGVLQQVVQKENNSYVRLRCQRALEDMNASVGTF